MKVWGYFEKHYLLSKIRFWLFLATFGNIWVALYFDI